MDISEIIQIGAQLFQSKLDDEGDGLDIGDIVQALSGLFSDNKGNIDLSSVLSNMDAGDLVSVAASWLGNGENDSISTDQVKDVFGADKISDFASQLGLSEDSALGGLSDVLPNIIDKSSSDGSLLDSIGGISGAIGMLGSLGKMLGR